MRRTVFTFCALPVLVLLVALVSPGLSQTPSPSVAAAYLIVPGQSIGPVRLGMQAQDAVSALGNPKTRRTQNDGSVVYQWYGPPDNAGIGLRASRGGEVIGIWAQNDGKFATRERLHPGSTDEEIRKALGRPSWWDEDDEDRWIEYVAQGVRFEINLDPDYEFINTVWQIQVFSPAQVSAAVTYIGFSASVPPGNNPDFRLALAYAVDKIAVASAVAAHYGVAPRPAAGIDHPELPGYNPAVHGYPYDPARAKEFYARSGWNGPITVITSPLDTTFSETLGRAVTSTIQASLGVPVKIDSTSDFPTLVSRATAGTAPIYMISWRTNTQDYGYPSFALGIAHERFLSDPEVKARVDARDARSTEQMLLDKGLILPLFFRLTR